MIPTAPSRARLALLARAALFVLVCNGCGDRSPADTDRDAGPPPLLPDVTTQAGVTFVHEHGGHGRKYLFETMGSGVACSDLDGDGLPDLLFLQSGTLPPDEFTAAELKQAGHASGGSHRLYLNQGDLRFRDATAGSGLERPVYAMGVACGDVDADGDRDVFVACYGQDQLFLNDGSAHFTEVGREVGLSDPRWTISGVFFDAELDGDLDLYTVSYLDMPVESHRFCGPSRELRTYCHVDSWPGIDDHLWLNDGLGRFVDGSAAADLVGTVGKGLAAMAGDYDDDGDADLFVANDSVPNLVLRNEGGGRFRSVGAMSGADLNGEGRTEACMGTDMGDLDGDGDLDMYVVNFEQETNTLYRNDGGGFFTDVSVLSGAGAPSMRSLGFGTAFLDLENDGDLDIYVANGHILDNAAEVEESSAYAQVDQLYLNDGGSRFALAPAGLSPALSEPRVGRGVARADLDRDGDTDLVVTNSNQAPWILRNDVATGHRLALRLAGPGGRADAENARITARVGGRTLVRELTSGGSYLCQHDTEVLLGLGDAVLVERLTIRWPGGATTEMLDVPADRRLEIAFGGQVLRDEPLPPLGVRP